MSSETTEARWAGHPCEICYDKSPVGTAVRSAVAARPWRHLKGLGSSRRQQPTPGGTECVPTGQREFHQRTFTLSQAVGATMLSATTPTRQFWGQFTLTVTVCRL